jgi:hypothetical protein
MQINFTLKIVLSSRREEEEEEEEERGGLRVLTSNFVFLNVYLHEHRQTRYHTRCQRGRKVGCEVYRRAWEREANKGKT